MKQDIIIKMTPSGSDVYSKTKNDIMFDPDGVVYSSHILFSTNIPSRRDEKTKSN
jgi:hypothetical protein